MQRHQHYKHNNLQAVSTNNEHECKDINTSDSDLLAVSTRNSSEHECKNANTTDTATYILWAQEMK